MKEILYLIGYFTWAQKSIYKNPNTRFRPIQKRHPDPGVATAKEYVSGLGSVNGAGQGIRAFAAPRSVCGVPVKQKPAMFS